MAADYSYQAKLVDAVWHHLHSEAPGVVLGATPGSGKTEMAIEVARRWFEHNPGDKALILTHGQTVLRQQFYRRIAASPRIFTFTALGEENEDSSAQVHVALPHYFRKKDPSGYALIVVDEAHHFFDAEMVLRILCNNPGAKLLLLTGTPSPFIQSGRFPLVPITVSELLEHGVLTDPYIELVQTSVQLSLSDYTASEDIRPGHHFTASQTNEALDSALNKLLERLTDRLSSKLRNPESSAGTVWKMVRGIGLGKALLSQSLGKTMVICHDQRQAQDVQHYFNKRGLAALLSTSDTDTDSLEVDRFRSEPDARILIVVNRAILGFDMPDLENVVDLSMSHNPDRIFQSLCRVVRPGSNGQQKIYLKVTTRELAPLTYVVMSFTVALSLPKYFCSYDGTWQATQVPVLKDFKAVQKALRAGMGGRQARDRSAALRISMPRLPTFVDLQHLDNDVAQSFAYTTFREVRSRISGSPGLSWEDNFEAYLKHRKAS